MESGYDEYQLITVGGIPFTCKIYGAWKDGSYIEAKDFSPEIKLTLASHHADTLRQRLNHVGDANKGEGNGQDTSLDKG